MIDIVELKRANRIEEVITGHGYALKGRGKYLNAESHDSLVVNVEDQLYFWNSQGHKGDVINWLENTQGMDFNQAIKWLANRGGIALHLDAAAAAAFSAARKRADVLTAVMEFLEGKLTDAAATAYYERRGWSAETVTGCGFWDGDRKGLTGHCQMHELDVNDQIVQAVMAMPAGMWVYGHWAAGRCEYVSARSVAEKRHWNPPVDLAGERLPLWNRFAQMHNATFVVLVEGQADALTLAQWNAPAVALAGASANDKLLKQLGRFDRVYVALDNDQAGQRGGIELARRLGPTTRIVAWPGGDKVKDANDWLVVAGASNKMLYDVLGNAPIFALWMCHRAAAAAGIEKEEMVKEAAELVATLPEYHFERVKKAAADALQISLREFSGMVKALQKTTKGAAHKIELTKANGFIDDHLFELVYDPDHEGGPRTAFAVRGPDGRLSISPTLDTENYRIFPFTPFESVISTGTIRLPSGLGHYTSEMELQGRVQAFIHKYVDLPPDIETLASYYVMLTWLFDKFYVLPYLRARGDSDSGKSRFTEVVGELCMRALFVTGSTTPSPVFRTMEKWGGCTVTMDEADLPHSETSSDWVQMLNTGYKQGFGILRTNMANGEAVVEVFSAFGPKILNMRGRFVDDATESRCLTWETSSGRGVRPDIERFIQDREGYKKEAREIRNALLAFRLKRWRDVTPNYNAETMAQMPGRLVEITVPLLSISEEEKFKESIMDFVEKMNRKAITQRSLTLTAKVLQGLLTAFYLPDEAAKDAPDALRLQVAHITRQTNRLINQENSEASLHGDDEEVYGKGNKQMSSGFVGKILNNDLNLETEKSTMGTRPMVLKWDAGRIGALIVRYGMEELVAEMIQKSTEAEQAAAQAANDEAAKSGQQGAITF
ncbi:MAG: toprim domain-containing protein [Chloroflexi bacterium]|nr:toprim domain-containing protein [Chloroflexota bacterium]